MLGPFARWSVRKLVRFYYPGVVVEGADRVPQEGPVLLCANHANSLLDPVLVGIGARRPVRFMAKAPLFDTPVFGRIMYALGMIPAFRGQDDPKQVRRNLESLDTGAKVLLEGSAMGIFPEGKSHDRTGLEQIRSGAARMAIQACLDGADDLVVVPMGINYGEKERFRSSVWVRIAEPIKVKDLLAAHENDERKARRELTETLKERLRDVVIHLDEPEWDPYLTDLEDLVELDPGEVSPKVKDLAERKMIADGINRVMAEDRERGEGIGDQIREFREQVHAAGLQMDSPLLKHRQAAAWGRMIASFLWTVILLTPAIAGAALHAIPFALVRLIAGRLDQPGRMTVALNRLLIGIPAYVGWYFTTTWWAYEHLEMWQLWVLRGIMPVTGLIAIHYLYYFPRVFRQWWHTLDFILRPARLRPLLEARAALAEELMALARTEGSDS